MVVDSLDDRWREVATWLIADTELFERRFDRDLFGELGPRKPVGAYVLEASRLVITRIRKITGRLDALHGNDQLWSTSDNLQAATTCARVCPVSNLDQRRGGRAEGRGDVHVHRDADGSPQWTASCGEHWASCGNTWWSSRRS